MAEDPAPFRFLLKGKTRVGKNPGLGFTINVSASISDGEKQAHASLAAAGNDGIGLADLVRFFKPDFDEATIPGFLKSPRFKSFSITYGSGAKSTQFILGMDTQLEIGEKKLDIILTYNSRSDTGDKSVSAFGGTLTIDQHVFTLRFLNTTLKGQTTSYLFAAYDHKGAVDIDLQKIGKKILPDALVSQVPDISINVAIEDFTAFLLYSKSGDAGNILFGMGAGVSFSLDNLPMAGEILAKEKSFGLKRVLLTISKGTFQGEELEELQKTLPVIPAEPISPDRHFGIATLMKIGDTEEYYSLLPEPAAKVDEPKDDEPPSNYTPVPGAVSGKAKWIKVGKQLGPVDLQRVGIGYIDKKIVILLDAGITISVLSIQLKGLGLGFKVKWKIEKPDFYIDGLGLSFKKDPIEISGLLLRVDPKPNEQFSFYGAAKISTSKFSIAGIGAYSKLKVPKDQISFFIYAMYSGPIGGPAFFFVTGIAAGFGYNRRIRVPRIEQVRDFPLVAMALNPDPAKKADVIVDELITKDWIPSSPGDYWLAIGIRFNSFKLIDSFVLVTVQFGTRVEFALLGLSILKWPAAGTPIAYVELAILVRFGQGSDVIAVDAMITHNSYILDKNCRLTGGFAFYAWVSGPHEGDFVITLGGYHPRFKVPAHYPRVERLALTWKLSDMLSIHGEMYYALTPTAIMAGGRWEVEYNLSFLRASLTLWADMIISWAPFYYEINAGIRVRIEARIKVLFVRVYFSLEMGAELHIWGPPFAGEVYVDWTIFSFTIPFGAGKKQLPPPLSWSEFTKSFLPAQKTDADKPDPIGTRISGGIIRQYKDKKGYTITLVNPHELVLVTETLIPVTRFKTKDGQEIAAATLMETGDSDVFSSYDQRTKELGIAPMDLRPLDSNLFSWIEKKGTGDQWELQPMHPVCTAKGVADALWGLQKPEPGSTQVPEAKIIKRVMSGVQFRPIEPNLRQVATEKSLEKDVEYIHPKKELTVQYPVNSSALDNIKNIKEIIRKSMNRTEKLEVAGTLEALGFGLYTKEELSRSRAVEEKGIEWLDTPYLAVPGGNIPINKRR